jgi:translation initiation factor IF-3
MDYGRFKYEQSKKAKEAKKHASTVELKEIKFRPKTDEHDLAFKIKHVTRFLEDGNKCRLVVIFRGREVVHPKTGLAVLDRVLAATSELSQVEVRPNLEGKRMIMIIGPKPGIKRKTKSGGDAQQVSKRQKGKNKPKDVPVVEEAEELSEKTLEELNAAAEAEAEDDDDDEEVSDTALAGADTDDADDSELDKKTPAPDAAIEMAESVAPSAPADS